MYFSSVFDNPLLNAQIAAAMPKAGPAILPILRHTILREAPEVVAPPALALFHAPATNLNPEVN